MYLFIPDPVSFGYANFKRTSLILVLLAGFQIYAPGVPAATNDPELIALRAKLNGVWTVDSEQTKESWGFTNEDLPPFLDGTLKGFQNNIFEFRPDFIIMTYAKGGKHVSTQRVDMEPLQKMEGVVTFERDTNLPPEFLGAAFTSTNTMILIRTLDLTQLCLKRNTNATIEPYGRGFELTVPCTYKDTKNATNRVAFNNRLSSALKAAKLGVLIDVQYMLPPGKRLISEDVLASLEKIESELRSGKFADSHPAAPDAPAKKVYMLELYDLTKNSEALGSLFKSVGCSEDSELKALDDGSAKIVSVRELLQKK